MSEPSAKASGPHAGQTILTRGEPIEQAQAAMIMVHGRGGTAEDILDLTTVLTQPGFTFLAPQAAGNTWYPNSFLMPIASNEPGLSSGLSVIQGLLAYLAEQHIPAERTILLGFSQGACLSLEFSARNAQRYGGIACLSGGLIGPDGTPREYPASLAGTPTFLGCSDIDPHVPKERVVESAAVLRRLGGDVSMQLYPGMGHLVSLEEVDIVLSMMAALIH